MSNSVKIRGLLVVACLVFAITVLTPTLMGKKTPAWLADTFNPISLGLDLQGGMHLVLGVEVEKAYEARIDNLVDQTTVLLKEKDIVFKRVNKKDQDRLSVVVYDQETAGQVQSLMEETFYDMEAEALPLQGGYTEIFFQLSDRETREIKDYAIRQALETLRNRVDEMGLTEPTLQIQSDNRILVQLPGVKDPDRALKLLGETALLEFKMVAENVNLEEAQQGKLPPGTQLLYMVDKTPGAPKVPIVVFSRTSLTGDLLSDAQFRIDTRFNDPYVSLDFNKIGAKRFEQLTGSNTGKRMAIVLDGKVYSAPTINEKIRGGKAMISGSFTPQEATDLAIVLRAGSLPAPVKILENRTVGASLGADSINQGIRSVMIGGILVVVAIAIYYQLSGLVAVTALVLNLVFISAMLALFGATLTLPGIAGIVLTVGMAVDANVLIFERIREELRLGKSSRMAVETGFGKAFLTIIDANLTTLIAALVLFQFGTGPVKGFAVTLSIGILASLFTAVFVSRMVFDLVLERKAVKRLSI